MMTWQPIETAPENVPVLLFCPEETPKVVVGKHVVDKDEEWDWWAYEDPALADISPEGPEPTHWMHLPEPPEES